MALIVSSYPANRSNFVTWYKTLGGYLGDTEGNYVTTVDEQLIVVSATLGFAGEQVQTEYCFDDSMASREMTRPYPKIRMHYHIPAIPGVRQKFFTNFDTVQLPENFSIRAIKDNQFGEEITDQFIIEYDELSSGQLFIQLVPKQGVRNYAFRLCIVDEDAQGVSYFSRPFQINPNWRNVFALNVEPQNSVYFNYPYLDPEVDSVSEYTQTILCWGNLVDMEFTGEQEVYKEVSTGLEREELNTIGRTYEVETYYFDYLAHEAMASMLFHRNKKINEIPISLSGNYTPGMAKERDISSGTFTAIDLRFGQRTKSCT